MSEFKCSVCGAVEGEICKRSNEPMVTMEAPHSNAYWTQVQSKVCAPRWVEWKEMEIKILNEYRLNLLEREHRKLLKKYMTDFLDLDGTGTAGQAPGAVAQEWVAEDSD